MRVLFVSNLYPPNVVGGYEELCHEVASRFAARGHEVAVLTSCYGGRTQPIPGQVVHQSLRLIVGRTIYDGFDGPPSRRALLRMQNVAALKRAVAGFVPDVVFCWNLYGLDRDFFDALAGTGLPVVAMLTDNWLAAMENPAFVGAYFRDHVLGTPATPWPDNGGVSRRLPANVSAIFGAGFMRDFYAAAGLHFDRDVVIHNGVNLAPELDGPRGRPARQPGDPVRLLFAGRVVEIKGAHTAVEALGRLRREAPGIDWRLTLVGDSRDRPYLDRLKTIAAEDGTRGAIDFVERVAPSELVGLFDAHDIYLFPSYYEPFSLTLIHALAAGIPTVASATGGNVEIVAEGETGLLFAKGDAADLARAVARLQADPALAERVGTAGARAARRYSTEAMIAAMEAHLASVATGAMV